MTKLVISPDGEEVVDSTPAEVADREARAATAAAEATDHADRDADAAALRDDLQTMKDVRDEAATSRTEMDAPDGEGSLSRWNPVKEITDEAFPDPLTDLEAWQAEVEARIDDQAKLLNLVAKEMRRMYGDIRVTAAALVRKFRKDRDDE